MRPCRICGVHQSVHIDKEVCKSCSGRSRCKVCDVILKKSNKCGTQKTCWYCATHPIRMKFVCHKCGRTIKGQNQDRWELYGNWCNSCILEAKRFSMGKTSLLEFVDM